MKDPSTSPFNFFFRKIYFDIAPDLRPEDRAWLHDYLFGHYTEGL